ncbi:hypothetical protein ABT224_12395, partial [Streptomyces sp. NPDC001584]
PLEALTAGYRAAFTVSAAVLATTALLALFLTRRTGARTPAAATALPVTDPGASPLSPAGPAR